MSRFHCLAMQINRRSAGVGGEDKVARRKSLEGLSMEELDRLLEKSRRKQRIAIRIQLAAVIGSLICTAAMVIYQIVH